MRNDFEVERTSQKTWKITEKWDKFFVWIDVSGCLHCSCPFYVGCEGRIDCKHIRAIKESIQ